MNADTTKRDEFLTFYNSFNNKEQYELFMADSDLNRRLKNLTSTTRERYLQKIRESGANNFQLEFENMPSQYLRNWIGAFVSLFSGLVSLAVSHEYTDERYMLGMSATTSFLLALAPIVSVSLVVGALCFYGRSNALENELNNIKLIRCYDFLSSNEDPHSPLSTSTYLGAIAAEQDQSNSPESGSTRKRSTFEFPGYGLSPKIGAIGSSVVSSCTSPLGLAGELSPA